MVIRADDRFFYEDEDGKKIVINESNFEILKKEVEVLKYLVNDMVLALRDNEIRKKVDLNLFEDLFQIEEEQKEDLED